MKRNATLTNTIAAIAPSIAITAQRLALSSARSKPGSMQNPPATGVALRRIVPRGASLRVVYNAAQNCRVRPCARGKAWGRTMNPDEIYAKTDEGVRRAQGAQAQPADRAAQPPDHDRRQPHGRRGSGARGRIARR